MFICGIIGYSLKAMMYSFDPGFQIHESYTWIYNIFEILTVIILISILINLIIYMIKVWINWPSLLVRHKVAFMFSIYFIFAFLIFLISETGKTYFESGKRAILLTCLANMYVFFLQYMYSISPEGEKGKFKLTYCFF